RDHAFPTEPAPTVFMMSNPLALPSADSVERGAALVTAKDDRRLHCDLQAIALLRNVLPRQYAVHVGAVGAVLLRHGPLRQPRAGSDREAQVSTAPIESV